VISYWTQNRKILGSNTTYPTIPLFKDGKKYEKVKHTVFFFSYSQLSHVVIFHVYYKTFNTLNGRRSAAMPQDTNF
jgi:hypothetical protein